ncbi:MAG: 4-demethylwyosine synthase TYW1 [Candidatus Pacearchaeota archaeon]
MNRKTKQILEKQGYAIYGDLAIQICRWTKKSLLNKGFCYKQKFYGIQSHRCCQMSPCVMNCHNRCLHCWRPIELNEGIKMKGKIMKPQEIIEKCIEMQKKMIVGFKGNAKTNIKKYSEAMFPNQFAISLSGEPTIYPYLGELIEELKKRKITSFLVTNGLNPDVLIKLNKKNQLPTQLYLSMIASNKNLYDKLIRSQLKDAWKKYMKTIKIFPKLKTRKVIRITLIKDLNMSDELLKEYAKIIKISKPDFIEVKSFMSVGFSRQRLGYEKMPVHKEIKDFSKKLAKLTGLKILNEKKESRVVLLGKSKKNIKIKKI